MLEVVFAAAPVQQCSDVIVPQASEVAMRYYESGNILWIFQQAWSLLIPLLFLLWGFTGKLAKCAEKWGRVWFFALAAYLVLFIALYQLLFLPLDFYGDYIRQHEYGLSTETLGKWFSNYGKGVGVTVIASIAFVWIFYLVIKRSPRRWWFYGSLVSTLILFIMAFVQPIWIDPLFNQFGPMKNKELEEKILHLASRAGIEHARVFEVDKSQETKTLNAYVVGFGSSGRIVLWDTTIEKLTPDEILFVMGHEMGHYVLHHIWWGLLYYAALSFVIFYLTYKVAAFCVRKFQKRFGFKHLHNIASLPLFLFLITFFLLLFTPLSTYLSRLVEHEADRFGLEITQNNQAAADAFIALQQQNLANPYPGMLYTIWRSDHPSLGSRVEFCNSYCPWKREQPLEYSHYFKE